MPLGVSAQDAGGRGRVAPSPGGRVWPGPPTWICVDQGTLRHAYPAIFDLELLVAAAQTGPGTLDVEPGIDAVLHLLRTWL
jgi:hypothetical protein